MVVCCESCEVEVCESGWSLVQKSPTECSVFVCNRETSVMNRVWLNRYCWRHGKKVQTSTLGLECTNVKILLNNCCYCGTLFFFLLVYCWLFLLWLGWPSLLCWNTGLCVLFPLVRAPIRLLLLVFFRFLDMLYGYFLATSLHNILIISQMTSVISRTAEIPSNIALSLRSNRQEEKIVRKFRRSLWQECTECAEL